MGKRQTPKTNVADLRKNTRVKLVASVKTTLGTLLGDLESEIARLNGDSTRPIHKVNDLAQMPVGQTYLQAPENITGNDDAAWAVQLGRLYQDAKQLQRRVLRAEQMARGEKIH